MITASFTYSSQDMVDGIRAALHGRLFAELWRATFGRRRSPKRLFAAVIVIQLAACTAGVLASAWLGFSRQSFNWLFAIVGFGLLPGFYAYVMLKTLGAEAIRKRFEDAPHHDDVYTVTADDAGFTLTSDHEAFGAEWPAVRRLSETPRLVLLQTRTARFIIPRRAFTSAEQLQAFLDIVRAHLPAD